MVTLGKNLGYLALNFLGFYGCLQLLAAPHLIYKYLLGQGQDGWQRVKQVYKGSDREEFFKQLRDFLQANGYI